MATIVEGMRLPVNDRPDRFHDPAYMLTFMRTRAALMAFTFLTVLALVIIYLALAPRHYTAKSMVIIDPRRQMATGAPVLSGLEPDAAILETELQILGSRSLANQVAVELKLTSNKDFASKPTGVRGMMNADQAAQNLGERDISDKLLNHRTVKRAGASYAIGISYSDPDPALASAIANSFARNYVANQVKEKDIATRSANAQLRTRLTEIGDLLKNAENNVADYRRRTGLISAVSAQLAEEQITDLSTQVAAASGDAARQRALADAERTPSSASAPSVIASPVIQQLRTRQADLAQKLAELRTRYGPQHPLVIGAEEERLKLDTAIASEIVRTRAAATSMLAAQTNSARDRAGSQAASLLGARSALANNNFALVHLAALERDAASLRSLYENYAEHYNRTGLDVGMQTADARIISLSVPPRTPATPKPLLTMALGALLGVFAALALAILAELRHIALTRSSEIERQV